MLESIESELIKLEQANFSHLIPAHLLSYIKNDINDRILPNLIADLDNLLQTIDADNFFKILSFKEISADLDASCSLSRSSANCDGLKSSLIEISARLAEILGQYSHELNEYVALFDRLKSSHGEKLLGSSSRQELLLLQRAILVQKLSSKHYDLLGLLFRNVFDLCQKYSKAASPRENQELPVETIDDNSDEDPLRNHQFMSNFHRINQILFGLELFDNLCGDIVVEVVENKIRQHIENTSMENYEESFIQSFEHWLDKTVIGWIKLIYLSSDQFSNFGEYLSSYKKQLAHFMYSHYAHTRIKRLFDIVIDFPDSKSAIDDLKICLAKTNMRSRLINDLKQSIEQRLLHPGVNTSDILTAYVSAIKALMCLDSSGVMMENVCEPLKRYLRNRDDTVKCIVSNLTTDDGDDTSNDLMEEFCKDLYSYEGVNNNDCIDSSTAEEYKLKSWQLWLPDPIDALNTGGSGGANYDGSSLGSKSNIISMLVNIYGSFNSSFLFF
jgi:hypothetical protein